MEQQNQNVQIDEGISLLDIIRLLLGKLKLLVIVVLIGGILGGAFAIWRTIDVNYFGTKVEFYVNPEKPEESTSTSSGAGAGGSQYGVYGAYGRHVMDNMVKLLSSDSFAEKLLLNGSYLPELQANEETKWFADDEYDENGILLNDALAQAIAEAQPYISDVEDAQEAYNKALSDKVAVVKTYNKAETDLNSLWRTLFQKGEIITNSVTFTELKYKELANPPAVLQDAYAAYAEAQNNVTQKTTDVLNAETVWVTMKNLAFQGEDSPVETALNIWRQSSVYEELLSFYKESITYSYLSDDEDYENANNLARSFIYVKISVQSADVEEGTAIGTMLLERVKTVVPQYVEQNMTVPDGYSGTNCQRITRTDNIGLTNPHYTTKQAIKYGILMAAAAFIITSVIIVFLDKSDKRLRDTDIIVRKFNVPLLGIVPTIEELKVQTTAKKKADKTSEVK